MNPQCYQLKNAQEGPQLTLTVKELTPAALPIVGAWLATAVKALCQPASLEMGSRIAAGAAISALGPAVGLAGIPLKVAGFGGAMAAGAATQSAIGAAGAAGATSFLAAQAADNAMPFGSSFAADEAAIASAVGHELQTHVGLLSLTSAVMFIGSIRGLNSLKTAKQGNYMGKRCNSFCGRILDSSSPDFRRLAHSVERN